MTAIHTVQLICACGLGYPEKPTDMTVSALRAEAAAAGWETMRGKHGADVCPKCRIKAIKRAAGFDDVKAAPGVKTTLGTAA
jgi:hypothetical protein